MRRCLDCPELALKGGHRCRMCARRFEARRRYRENYADPAYKRLREAMLRGGPLCALCGDPGADTLDHIVPGSRGGTNDPTNLQPAHRACNSRKANQ